MKSFCLYLVLLSIIGCGTTKEEEKKKLDANTVTLEPAPGEYKFKPWVILSKKDDGIGSGILYIKTPSDTEFKSATLGCYDSPYESGSASVGQGYCAQVTQTGTLTYYLENSEARSAERSAAYTISPETVNLTATSKTAPDSEGTVAELNEIETVCKFSESSLEIFIQVKNEEKLSSERFGYFFAKIEKPVAGQTYKFNGENESEVGLDIKPTTDPFPTYFFSMAYSTKASTSTKDSECEISITDMDRGKVVNGSLTCKNLRSNEYAQVNDKLFGNLLDLSGKWQCDGY